MDPSIHVDEFVKGYAFNDEKAGRTLGFDGSAEPHRVSVYVEAIVRTALEDGEHRALELALDNEGRAVFILILDYGRDLEKPKKRPCPEPTPSMKKIMEVLDGPVIYPLV